MSEKASGKRKGKLVFRGLAALCAWLLVLLLFGSQIATNYATTINNFLGIQTTRVVEVDE